MAPCTNSQCSETIEILARQRDDLEKRIRESESHKRQSHPIQRSWPDILKRFLRSQEHKEPSEWKAIYDLACREENSSPGLLHPGLYLRSANQHEQGLIDAGPPTSPEVTPQPTTALSQKFFDMKNLDSNLLIQILGHVLQQGRIIHAISRLDPSGPINLHQAAIPRVASDRSGLLKRFHVGRQACFLTMAIDPKEHLAPLMVCREWFFYGVHIFYGTNIFAFSSLGELGKFSQGIGSRWQRVQHVSLLWIGSNSATRSEPLVNKTAHARRTADLQNLLSADRLATLSIHIQETNSRVVRRRTEGEIPKRNLAGATELQPNCRHTRAHRVVQGMDYVYQLRGMKWVRFFDYDKYISLKEQIPIRDWAFLADVNTQTVIAKPPNSSGSASDSNQFSEALLSDTTSGWRPSIKDHDLVDTLFKGFDNPDSAMFVSHPTEAVELSEDAAEQHEHVRISHRANRNSCDRKQTSISKGNAVQGRAKKAQAKSAPKAQPSRAPRKKAAAPKKTPAARKAKPETKPTSRAGRKRPVNAPVEVATGDEDNNDDHVNEGEDENEDDNVDDNNDNNVQEVRNNDSNTRLGSSRAQQSGVSNLQHGRSESVSDTVGTDANNDDNDKETRDLMELSHYQPTPDSGYGSQPPAREPTVVNATSRSCSVESDDEVLFVGQAKVSTSYICRNASVESQNTQADIAAGNNLYDSIGPLSEPVEIESSRARSDATNDDSRRGKQASIATTDSRESSVESSMEVEMPDNIILGSSDSTARFRAEIDSVQFVREDTPAGTCSQGAATPSPKRRATVGADKGAEEGGEGVSKKQKVA